MKVCGAMVTRRSGTQVALSEPSHPHRCRLGREEDNTGLARGEGNFMANLNGHRVLFILWYRKINTEHTRTCTHIGRCNPKGRTLLT